MSAVTVINMIPQSLSGETNQDSEPNLAVNPANTQQMVATAFTPAPLGGTFAPVYVSTNGGTTWSLNTIVPGNGPAGTMDITVAFGTGGGVLYAGIINGTTKDLNVLRTASFAAASPMTVLEDRASEDQPWTVAITAAVDGGTQDRVYIGNNDISQSGPTATVDLSGDAATAAAPAGFGPHQIEHRANAGSDAPPIRLAAHSDGTIYSAFERWASISGSDFTFDVVVTRDDSWGSGATPFGDLVDSGDQVAGQRVATAQFSKWNDIMGQERLGADLTIAVDPTNSSNVWVGWCDRVGGATGTDWTLHVSQSTDRGQTWSADARTITNVKNPSLAINSAGQLGLLYQAYTGTNWATSLELTWDAWATPAVTIALHTATASTPARTFLPYIGDYVRLLAVGTDFYGVFCGNNSPDMANFPSGVTYQRNADWTAHTLLSTDNTTAVAVSIDPFFFHYSSAPTVTSVSPSTGSSSGGLAVTVNGSGFTKATGVSFGGNPATGVSVVSDTVISCTSPAATVTGPLDVTVTTPAGTSATSPADQFTYTGPSPAVTGISPTSGTTAGGDSVTITGSGFTGATDTAFGTASAAAMTVDSDTQVTATSPGGTGTVDITVTTPAGTSATSPADQFTYS
jgi:hypothetical protein